MNTTNDIGFYWESLCTQERLSLIIRAGWITGKGKLSQTGKRVLRSNWIRLTVAAQNVLLRIIN